MVEEDKVCSTKGSSKCLKFCVIVGVQEVERRVSEVCLYHLHVCVDTVVQHGGRGRKGGVRNSCIACFLWS